MSSSEPAAIQPMHRSFHTDASNPIQQYAPPTGDNSTTDICTPSCGVDSSSVSIRGFRYPSPSAETYRLDNGPNGRLFHIILCCRVPGCTHDDNRVFLPSRRCTVR